MTAQISCMIESTIILLSFCEIIFKKFRLTNQSKTVETILLETITKEKYDIFELLVNIHCIEIVYLGEDSYYMIKLRLYQAF